LHEPQTLALTLTLTQLQCACSALLSLVMALQIFRARILAIQLPSFVQLQWEKLAEDGEIVLASNQVDKLCTEEHYQVFQQALQTVVVCVEFGSLHSRTRD
jgi:hypothetical protein